MVILMVGLLGMLQAINLSIVTNLQNEVRNQAVAIAEDQMARKKSLPFDNITVNPPLGGERSIFIRTPMRKSFMNYSVTMGVTNIGNGKQVDIGVRWLHKGNKYEHVISTIVAPSATP